MTTEAMEGTKVLFRMLTGKHQYAKYTKEEWKEPLFVKLPVANAMALKDNQSIEFVGSEGITASIGEWIIQVVDRLADVYWEIPIKGLRRILFDTDENCVNQHMVYHSVVFDDYSELMVGGCTDYSGEGGRGNLEANAFLAALSLLFGVPITQEHHGLAMYEETSKIITDAANERYQESVRDQEEE